MAAGRVDARGEGRGARAPDALLPSAYVRQLRDAAGLPTFEIAQYMGTSIEQISKTYGHLLSDSFERGRLALDSFDAEQTSATARL